MELKAKLVSRWAASILDCLKHLHQPRRRSGKKKVGREREREGRERERKREEADELGLMERKAKLIPR